jgi:TRAP-type transport system periplasmic protein
MMKKWVTSAAVFTMAIGVAGCGASQTAAPTPKSPNPATPANNTSPAPTTDKKNFVIKLGHVVAPEHPYQKGAEKFKEIVESKSNGRIKVQIYPSSQIGDEKKLVESMRNGTVEMGIIGGTMGIVEPKFLVADLPFAFKDAEHAYKALDGDLGNYLFKLLPDKNLKGLAFWENGFRDVTNSKRPIKTPDDLKGLKIRVPENKASLMTFQALGANATPMSFSELFQALESKVVDGQENPIANTHSSKFNEVQKYFALTGHQYGSAPVIMSLSFYNSLPEDLKKVVDDAAIEARDYERKVNQDNEAKLLADLKTKGMEVTEVDKKLFMDKVDSVYKEFEPIVGKDLIDMIRKQQ